MVQSLAGSGLPQSDKTTDEPKRFMAIISAPVLLNFGRQVDEGFFCFDFLDTDSEDDDDDDDDDEKRKDFRIKYTSEELSVASYGRVVEGM